jgi:hypothetical protein
MISRTGKGLNDFLEELQKNIFKILAEKKEVGRIIKLKPSEPQQPRKEETKK